MSQAPKKTYYEELPHVLVVDDDVRICELAAKYLSKNHYMTMSAHSAEQAREILDNYEFDALIVDIMMPGETGLEFAHSLKKQGVDLPIIMLTALGEVEDRIKGFESGADDYLPKPFEPRELLMRLEAILRRVRKKVDASNRYKIGRWIFDSSFSALEVEQSGERILLTEMENKLLKALAQNNGQTLSRERLSVICELDGGERAIDVQVTRLRKKIEEDSKAPRVLQTVRGKGYLLRAQRLG